MPELIGHVTLTPDNVVPGQSVFVQVTGPNGEVYPINGETIVRINGVLGAEQYLQFERPGDHAILVNAARNGIIETQEATVHVAAPETPTPAIDGNGMRIMALMHHPGLHEPPRLNLARSPRQPYAAAFSLGRDIFPNGLSQGPGMIEAVPPHPGLRIGIGEALSQPHAIAARSENTSAISRGLMGSRLFHRMHEMGAERARDARFLPGDPSDPVEPSVPIGRLPDMIATPIPGGIAAEPLPRNTDTGLTYHWDFGDGTTLTTRQLAVEHDFEAALDPDQEHHTFHVAVRIEEPGQPSVEVKRTLYVHNAYALCKKLGTLVPKAHSMTFASKALGAWEASVTIDNVEAFPIVLTSRVVHVMMGDDNEADIPGQEEALRRPIAVPPKGSVVVPVTVPLLTAPPGAIGFAITFCGAAPDGKPIRVETHFDIAAKDRASASLKIGNIAVKRIPALREAINAIINPPQNPAPAAQPAPDLGRFRLAGRLRNTLFTTSNGFAHLRSARGASDALPMATRAIVSSSVLDQAMRGAIPTNMGLLTRLTGPTGTLIASNSADPGVASFTRHLMEFGLTGTQHLFQMQTVDPPVEGKECDPDNSPDEVFDDPDSDWVCQATPEKRTVITPGRFLNARKGDIVLSPGGPGVIGQLLRQVNPPQRYSHSGIMTRNYDQITHCTASEDRMLDYPVGGILGKPAPTDGHRPDVVKYGWPGIITQSVEEALHGEEMTDPENGKKYKLSGFSRESVGAVIGGNWEIIHPLVIKPDPIEEGKDPEIRKKLRHVATDALAQTGKGHYRFYCYTDPTIADDPTKVGPPESGWAQNTWPSVCSSFIWHMLKKHGVHLESDAEIVTSGDLEDMDRAAGGQVGPNTKDGLYLYSAEERLAGGEYLHQSLVDKVSAKLDEEAGLAAGIVDFFSDMCDDVANQIVNTFASDWADTEAKDSENWRNTVASSAVSPDNMLLWDPPSKKGLYGYAAPLIYREPRLETVTIHRWRKVQIKGTVTGVVRYNGQPKPGAMVQLYDGKTAFADGNGVYRIDHVPLGPYEAKASSDFGGLYLSATVPFTLSGPVHNLDIELRAPSDLFRRLKIEATIKIHDYHLIGSNPENTERHYRELYLGPFGTHGETSMETSTDEGEDIARFRVVADWNLDKSITIYLSHSKWEDDDQEGHVDRTFTLPPDRWQSWWMRIGEEDEDEDYSRVDVVFTNEVNPH
jgi:hypothetical protein